MPEQMLISPHLSASAVDLGGPDPWSGAALAASLGLPESAQRVAPDAPVPAPVVLRRFDDHAAVRKGIFDNVVSALQSKYPIEDAVHSLHLENLAYEKPRDYSHKERKLALLRGETLEWKLKGDWILKRKSDGGEVARKNTVVAHVPWLADDGTFTHKGSAYKTASQLRLLPGMYARRRDSGEAEVHCLYNSTEVWTENGMVPIGTLVREKREVRVWSYDFAAGQFVLKPIVGWFKNKIKETIGRATFWAPGRLPSSLDLHHPTALWATPTHKVLLPDGSKQELSAVSELTVVEERPTAMQEQVLYGSLLGDGSINRRGQYEEAHSVAQTEYAALKARILSPFMRTSLRWGAPRGTISAVVWIRTKACAFIRRMRDLCYPDGVKRVSKEWLSRVDARGLAYWFCDDGCSIRNGNSTHKVTTHVTVTLATHGFTTKCVDELLAWLWLRWGVTACKNRSKVYEGRDIGWHILIRGEEAERFLDIVAPYVPPSLFYKLSPRPPTGRCVGCGKEVDRRRQRCNACLLKLHLSDRTAGAGGKRLGGAAAINRMVLTGEVPADIDLGARWDARMATAGTKLKVTEVDTQPILGLATVPCEFEHGEKLCRNDIRTAYDIEVADTHNYVADGVLVSNCNARPGTGPAHRVHLEPETGVFRLGIGQSTLKLYPILKAMGISDPEMETVWGKDNLTQNQEAEDPKALSRAFAKLVSTRADQQVAGADDEAQEKEAEEETEKQADDFTERRLTEAIRPFCYADPDGKLYWRERDRRVLYLVGNRFPRPGLAEEIERVLRAVPGVSAVEVRQWSFPPGEGWKLIWPWSKFAEEQGGDEPKQASPLLAHIGGVSGAGKSTVLDMIRSRYPQVVTKDIDDIDYQAKKLIGLPIETHGYSDNHLHQLAVKKQELSDAFLQEHAGKPVVYGGIHTDGPETMRFPEGEKLMVGTRPLTGTIRAHLRDRTGEYGRPLSDLPAHWRLNRADWEHLSGERYRRTSQQAIVRRIGQLLAKKAEDGAEEKQAAPAWVREWRSGNLSEEALQRAASTLEPGQLRFLRHLGTGGSSVADLVADANGRLVRKLPVNETKAHGPAGQYQSHLARSAEAERLLPGASARYLEVGPRGLFQEYGSKQVVPGWSPEAARASFYNFDPDKHPAHAAALKVFDPLIRAGFHDIRPANLGAGGQLVDYEYGGDLLHLRDSPESRRIVGNLGARAGLNSPENFSKRVAGLKSKERGLRIAIDELPHGPGMESKLQGLIEERRQAQKAFATAGAAVQKRLETDVVRKHWLSGVAPKKAAERVRVLLPHGDGPDSFLMQSASSKQYAGKHRFPGGKIEEGETPEQAVVRELKEELGIKADPALLERLSRIERKEFQPGDNIEHYFRLKGHGVEPGRYQASNDPSEIVNLIRARAGGEGYLGPPLGDIMGKQAASRWKQKLYADLEQKGTSNLIHRMKLERTRPHLLTPATGGPPSVGDMLRAMPERVIVDRPYGMWGDKADASGAFKNVVPTQVLGFGADSVAIKTKDGKVLKISRLPLPDQSTPGVLGAIPGTTGSFSAVPTHKNDDRLHYGQMPLAVVRERAEVLSQEARLVQSLAACGIRLGDNKRENFGSVDGRLHAIDHGMLGKSAPERLSVQQALGMSVSVPYVLRTTGPHPNVPEPAVVKQAEDDLWHGSSAEGLQELEPRPSNVLEGEKAVFATPDRDLAVAFSAPWRDEDFAQGYVNGKPYMREMYPNAFEQVYGGRPGSLYKLPGEGFSSDARLMPHERVRKGATRVLTEERIKDVLEALRKTRFRLIRHDEGGASGPEGDAALMQAAEKQAEADPLILDRLLSAKRESDRRNYSAKHDILRKLIAEHPGEFADDGDRRGPFVGLTHIPSGFRIHGRPELLSGLARSFSHARGGMGKEAADEIRRKMEKTAGGPVDLSDLLSGRVRRSPDPEIIAQHVLENAEGAKSTADTHLWRGFRAALPHNDSNTSFRNESKIFASGYPGIAAGYALLHPDIKIDRFNEDHVPLVARIARSDIKEPLLLTPHLGPPEHDRREHLMRAIRERWALGRPIDDLVFNRGAVRADLLPDYETVLPSGKPVETAALYSPGKPASGGIPLHPLLVKQRGGGHTPLTGGQLTGLLQGFKPDAPLWYRISRALQGDWHRNKTYKRASGEKTAGTRWKELYRSGELSPYAQDRLSAWTAGQPITHGPPVPAGQPLLSEQYALSSKLNRPLTWTEFLNPKFRRFGRHYGDLESYVARAQQLLPPEFRPTKVLGAGAESLAVQAANGKVLKLYKEKPSNVPAHPFLLPEQRLTAQDGGVIGIQQPVTTLPGNENAWMNRNIGHQLRRKGWDPFDLRPEAVQGGLVSGPQGTRKVIFDAGAAVPDQGYYERLRQAEAARPGLLGRLLARAGSLFRR